MLLCMQHTDIASGENPQMVGFSVAVSKWWLEKISTYAMAVFLYLKNEKSSRGNAKFKWQMFLYSEDY